MSDEIKSQIVTKAIDSDFLTFIKIAPFQICKAPIIPLQNPSKQLEWAVNIGVGAIYHPDITTGIYGSSIRVGYGARIDGSIYARNSVKLESGVGRNGPTLVFGGVASKGDFLTQGPEKRAHYNIRRWRADP